MPRLLLLAVPVLVAGGLLAVDAFRDYGGDPAFALRQERAERARVLDATTLERAVGASPEPRPQGPGSPARSVRCDRAGAGTATWRCTARYAGGNAIAYRVSVTPTGSWRGASADGAYVVYGDLPLGG